MKNEPYEALFVTTTGYYLYVQHTADDPECDFDFTIYDEDFLPEDGGLIGENTDWNLDMAADEIMRGQPIKCGTRAARLDIEDYRDYLEM